MCSSGGSDTQTVTQKWEPPEFLQPYLKSNAEYALPILQEKYGGGMPVYQGPRVSALTNQQMAAVGGIDNLVNNNPWAPGLMNVWNSTMSGQNTQPTEYNPYESVTNPYGGNSPYLQQMLDQSNQNITKNYQQSIAPQLASQAARSGAYGSANFAEQQGTAQKALADSIAANTTGILQGQYDKSANLAESAINRGAGLRESALGRGNQNWENSAQRQMQAMGLFPQLNQSALANYAAQMGAGDLIQQWNQQNIDADRQKFQEQTMAPAAGLQTILDFLRGYGGLGGTSMQQMSGAGGSPWMQALGGGLAATGAWNALK